jgi:hypothetical protein
MVDYKMTTSWPQMTTSFDWPQMSDYNKLTANWWLATNWLTTNGYKIELTTNWWLTTKWLTTNDHKLTTQLIETDWLQLDWLQTDGKLIDYKLTTTWIDYKMTSHKWVQNAKRPQKTTTWLTNKKTNKRLQLDWLQIDWKTKRLQVEFKWSDLTSTLNWTCPKLTTNDYKFDWLQL